MIIANTKTINKVDVVFGERSTTCFRWAVFLLDFDSGLRFVIEITIVFLERFINQMYASHTFRTFINIVQRTFVGLDN